MRFFGGRDGAFISRNSTNGKLTRVVEGKRNQGSGAFKEYAGPDGSTLRVMNPSVRSEANRRAGAAIASSPEVKRGK